MWTRFHLLLTSSFPAPIRFVVSLLHVAGRVLCMCILFVLFGVVVGRIRCYGPLVPASQMGGQAEQVVPECSSVAIYGSLCYKYAL